MELISTHNLTKTYGKNKATFTALKDISISINEGETIAIVGKSGSGKSTLMHTLALLDKPTKGRIMIDGADVSTLPSGQLDTMRNKSFGFVFQQFFLNANDTVINNVLLPLKIAGIGHKERRKRAMDVLRAVELDDKAESKAKDLSGGQKQRVVIARALSNNPRIIFADEPTGNLDSKTGETIEDLLFSLNEQHGITLIIVTHDVDLADRCDRQIAMKDGRIVEERRRK